MYLAFSKGTGSLLHTLIEILVQQIKYLCGLIPICWPYHPDKITTLHNKFSSIKFKLKGATSLTHNAAMVMALSFTFGSLITVI